MNQLYPIIRRVRRPLVRTASVTAAPVVAPQEKAADEAKPPGDGPPDKDQATGREQDARATSTDESAPLY